MKRILTAAVLVPAILYTIFWGHPWFFFGVVAVIASLCFHEYNTIVRAHGIPTTSPVGYFAGLILLAAPRLEPPWLTALALLALLVSLRLEALTKALSAAAALFFGVIYIYGAWTCANLLREISPNWLFFAVAINWVGDTAALYIGRTFGKNKLAPVVSPKKTWEGAAASTVASVGFGLCCLHYLMPGTPVLYGVALSAAASIAGQFGDLAESAIKRGAGVKDSGNLLPGHGGWLDRVDSTLFSMPAVYLLLKLPWRF